MLASSVRKKTVMQNQKELEIIMQSQHQPNYLLGIYRDCEIEQ